MTLEQHTSSPTMSRRWTGSIAVQMVVVAFLLLAPSAFAEEGPVEMPAPFEVAGYEQTYEVTEEEATTALETQQEAAGIPRFLESVLGADYAGVWFDNDAQEFVVPLVDPSTAAHLRQELAAADLTEAVRMPTAEFTWQHLEQVENNLSTELETSRENGMVLISIQPKTNLVEVAITQDASQAERAEISKAVASAGSAAATREISATQVKIKPLACTKIAHVEPVGNWPRWCDAPLRGGVSIGTNHGNGLVEHCTAGFKATGNTFGNRFLLTAGHCIAGSGASDWAAFTAGGKSVPIGAAEQWSAPPSPGDWAKINANGSAWDTNPWPSIIGNWGESEEWAIQGEAGSYMGEWVCHTGVSTGRTCGTIMKLELKATNGQEHLVAFEGCGNYGDSGGPIFSGHVALGIASAVIVQENGFTLPECGEDVILYNEITEATDALGVTVGPRLGTAPEAFTEEANEPDLTPSGGTQVRLHGLVNPHGITTNYSWEYGTTEGYGQSTSLQGAGAGYQRFPVSSLVTGLPPETVFHYRFRAQNAAGVSFGKDATFKTRPDHRPKLSSVTAVPGKLSATFKGTIDGQGMATSYHFDYGPTAAYGSSIPVPDASSGTGVANVSQTINEIEGTFHYRLVASNAEGTTVGPDQSVYVQERPGIVAQEPAAVTATGGTLAAWINPHGVATTYFFEYGLTSSYGLKTATLSAGAGNEASTATAVVTGLEFGTTYHYRVVAENWAGTRIGVDQAFTPGWILQGIPHNESSGVTTGLESVSCVSPINCTAAGRRAGSGVASAIVNRWNGSAWSSENVPSLGTGDTGSLKGISCPSTSLCMAVGLFENGTKFAMPQVDRWNGTSWSASAPPTPEGLSVGGAELNAVSCPTTSFCSAVGTKTMQQPNGVPTREPYLVRWNGTSWIESSVAKPGTSGLSTLPAVSCTSASDCWAVGSYVFSSTETRPYAEHWNGTQWSEQALPVLAAGEVEVVSISCTSTSACIAVGDSKNAAGKFVPSAERWNGTKWQAEAMPALSAGAVDSFAGGVSCSSATSCEMVSGAGAAAAFAERLRNGAWTIQTLATPEGWITQSGLRGISCAAEGECMAVGNVGNPKRPFAERFSKSLGESGAPTAAYAFDETSGTSAKDAAGNHTGTVTSPSWVEGKFGKALSFNGTSSCVSVPNSVDLQLSGSFTVEAQVNPTTLKQGAPIFFKEAESFYGYSLFFGAFEEGHVEGFIADKSQNYTEVDSPEKLAVNTWTHVSMTSDGTTFRLYVNGKQVDTGSAKAAAESNGPLLIGCAKNFGEYFNGKIDNVRIYPRALSPAEVETNKVTAV